MCAFRRTFPIAMGKYLWEAVAVKQELSSNVTTLVAKNDSLETSIRELTRKLDVLINRAMQEPSEGTVQPPPAPPETPVPSEDSADVVVIVPDDRDTTVVSLKRSLLAIKALHKRMKK